MRTQLITIDPLGGIESLQMKGDALDLRPFGRAAIERTTEIIWNEDKQAWGIKLLHGALAGLVTLALYCSHAESNTPDDFEVIADESIVPLWREYDDAVSAEVELVQGLRVAGIDC